MCAAVSGHIKSYLRSCESDNDGDSTLTAEFSVKYIWRTKRKNTSNSLSEKIIRKYVYYIVHVKACAVCFVDVKEMIKLPCICIFIDISIQYTTASRWKWMYATEGTYILCVDPRIVVKMSGTLIWLE